MVVLINGAPVVLIVTAPVPPLTVILVPAIIEVTPEFVIVSAAAGPPVVTPVIEIPVPAVGVTEVTTRLPVSVIAPVLVSVAK